MYHLVTVAGYAGREVRIKQTPGGKTVAQFSIGCQVGFGDNAKTLWFNVSVWEGLADVCARLIKKGTPVLVTGELRGDDSGNPRTWTDKQGNVRSSFDLTAREMRLLPQSGQAGKSAGAGAEDDEDDFEIPF